MRHEAKCPAGLGRITESTANRAEPNYNVLGNPNTASKRALNDVLISVLHGWGYTDVKTFGDPSYCTGPVAGFV